ncbi:MAG: class I SAM-dependent methyltransferase [Acidobacteria bacterium]|nr:class I SAM-dependent methyltransferase [Acidobacteriota bacterium]
MDHKRGSLIAIAMLSIAATVWTPIPVVSAQGAGPGAPAAQSLAPYVPTPQIVVDRMLELAQITKDDVVYDLGCGDGRIVITAAKKYGARGVGVDIDPERVAESEANAKRDGVDQLVTFKLQDAMTVDVSPATVVTLYLLSGSNLKLRPILTKQLRLGSRIVSHAFSMGDWEPEKVETFEENGFTRTIYLWRTDGTVRP